MCIIKNGKIIESATMDELKSETNGEENIYAVEINDTKLLEKSENITIIDEKKFKLVSKKEDVPDFVEQLVKKNIKIFEIKEEKISLEDAFLKRTGGNIIG